MRRLNKTITTQTCRVYKFYSTACKVSHRHFLYFKDFSTVKVTDTDWPFRFIAQGLDVCLAGMVSKAVVKMFSHLLDDTL